MKYEMAYKDLSEKEKEMIAKLVNWINEHDRMPTMRDVDAEEDMPAAATYINHFGGFKHALALAKDADAEKVQKLKDALLETQKRGFIPTIEWCKVNDQQWMVNYAKRYFGSWRGALIELGFSSSKERFRKEKLHKDREERKAYIISGLRKLYDELGRVPCKTEIDVDPRLPSYNACVRLFGSSYTMFEAAEFGKHYVTQRAIVDELKAIVKETGFLPQYSALSIQNHGLWLGINNLYDRCYFDAIADAGFDYKNIIRIEWPTDKKKVNPYNTIEKIIDGVMPLIVRKYLPSIKTIRTKNPALYDALRRFSGGYPLIEDIIVEQNPDIRRCIIIPPAILSKKELRALS